MFFPGLRNRNGSCALSVVFAALFCLLTAFSLVSCNLDIEWQDDHKLNPNLAGTWSPSDISWPPFYSITATTVSYSKVPYEDAEIVYVHNFNEAKTVGALIIKRKEARFQKKPYNAVFFKDLQIKKNSFITNKQMLLFDAWDQNDSDWDASVATLEAAKKRFAPENAALYGGGDAQGQTLCNWGNRYFP